MGFLLLLFLLKSDYYDLQVIKLYVVWLKIHIAMDLFTDSEDENIPFFLMKKITFLFYVLFKQSI